jgi:Protein of unknown function (DUF2877)
MRLSALSAGEHAPRRRFNGAVHSVFRHACNVRLDDGRLLALLAPQLANLPHGIRVEMAPEFAFADCLRVGQAAGCRADVLRFGEASLSIDLGRARPWRSDLAAPGIDLDRPEAALAWRTAWDALWRHERGASVTHDPHGSDAAARHLSPGAALRRTAFRDALRLACAARCLQRELAAAAVGRLIGRGPGLTPTGDDLLVGFLAGLRVAAGSGPERVTFLGALSAAVVDAAAATNEISRAFLCHAAAGSVAEPLARLARRIAEAAAPREVERATSQALRFGHTSGADAALGLLLGLAAWRSAWLFSEQAAKLDAVR